MVAPTPAQKKVYIRPFGVSMLRVRHNFETSCLLRYAGKELNDPRVLTDVGDVPIQEIRDCGVEDDRLMHVISESVKTVMEEVSLLSHNV